MCADYLFQQDKHYDVTYDTGDKVIQCGRHNDIFKFWLLWRAKVRFTYLADKWRWQMARKTKHLALFSFHSGMAGNGRICQANGTIRTANSISSRRTFEETRTLPVDCCRAGMHQRLLLVRADSLPHYGSRSRTWSSPWTGIKMKYQHFKSENLINQVFTLTNRLHQFSREEWCQQALSW